MDLRRLCPNLGGPHQGGSASICDGHPVEWRSMEHRWRAGDLGDCRVGRELLASVHRRMVFRSVRAYRTVSHTELSAIGGSPPFHLLAGDGGGDSISPPTIAAAWGSCRSMPGPGGARCQARRRMGAKWIEWLSLPKHRERRVVEALLPIIGEWVGRRVWQVDLLPDAGAPAELAASVTICVTLGGRRRRGAIAATRATGIRRITPWLFAGNGRMIAGSSRRSWALTSRCRRSCVG